MIYARPTVPLRAKKSWFFFNNYILALGSDITLPSAGASGEKVSTTLNQVIYLYFIIFHEQIICKISQINILKKF